MFKALSFSRKHLLGVFLHFFSDADLPFLPSSVDDVHIILIL